MTTAEILDRVLEPFTEYITPQAAQKILDIRPDTETWPPKHRPAWTNEQ